MLPMNSFQMEFNLGKCKLKTKIKASDTLPFTYDWDDINENKNIKMRSKVIYTSSSSCSTC